MKNNQSEFSPKMFYNNAQNKKSIIYKDNRNKSGIYRWKNLVNGKSYIGSAVNISLRLKNYYQISYLKSTKGKSIIYDALLKYGYSKFSLEILEYCEPDLIIEREQYYINLFKPEYNILKIAGSRLGSKHTEAAKALMSLYKPSILRKTNHLLAISQGYTTTIINNQNNTKKVYISMRAAAKDIGVSAVTLSNYIHKNKLLKGIYYISTNKNR